MHAELEVIDDVDELPVAEKEGKIPDEWIANWQLEKLDKMPVKENVLDLFANENDDEDDKEEEDDLYKQKALE